MWLWVLTGFQKVFLHSVTFKLRLEIPIKVGRYYGGVKICTLRCEMGASG